MSIGILSLEGKVEGSLEDVPLQVCHRPCVSLGLVHPPSCAISIQVADSIMAEQLHMTLSMPDNGIAVEPARRLFSPREAVAHRESVFCTDFFNGMFDIFKRSISALSTLAGFQYWWTLCLKGSHVPVEGITCFSGFPLYLQLVEPFKFPNQALLKGCSHHRMVR